MLTTRRAQWVAYLLVAVACSIPATAQISISGSPPAVILDFTEFTGAGFSPGAAAASGRLDSDAWAVSGYSEGSVAFGGTETSGDFARGPSTGGVTTGGTYAFDTGGGNVGLGVQPGGSDFTPGSFTLKLRNTTGGPITTLKIDYVVYYLNDQARGNSFNFSHSGDDSTYVDEPSLDVVSPDAAAGSWVANPRAILLTPVGGIANGDFYYLRWTGDDETGGGSRDEFALDDIRIIADPAPPECALVLGSVPAHLSFGNGDDLLVGGVFAGWEVTVPTVPVIDIPNDQRLTGMQLYFQVVMFNPTDFPHDPLQMSNGLKITIGGEASRYGAGSGLDLWAPMPPRLGEAFQPAFRIVR